LASDDDLAAALHKAATKEEFLKWIDEASNTLSEAVKIAAVPLDEFQSAAANFQNELDSANPLCRTLMRKLWTQQSVLAQKYKYAESMTRLAMFNAAIDLRRGGRGSLADARDPYGDGPFKYQPSDDGYTLTSGLIVNGEPFSMTFGKAAAPEVKNRPQLLVYDSDVDSASEIENALVSAGRENKRVLLQWGFNGCIPCYSLHRTMEQHDGVSKVLRDGFIRLTVDVTNDKNEPLLKKYGLKDSGVPHLTILDSDGSVLANVTPSQNFYDNGVLDAQSLEGFMEKWSPNAK
jgi:thioredoxin-related protein